MRFYTFSQSQLPNVWMISPRLNGLLDFSSHPFHGGRSGGYHPAQKACRSVSAVFETKLVFAPDLLPHAVNSFLGLPQQPPLPWWWILLSEILRKRCYIRIMVSRFSARGAHKGEEKIDTNDILLFYNEKWELSWEATLAWRAAFSCPTNSLRSWGSFWSFLAFRTFGNESKIRDLAKAQGPMKA